MDVLFGLKNKTAIVTGAASGIGKASALRLAKAGARLVCTDIADPTDIASEVGGLGICVDICSEAEIAELIEKARAFADGSIDILVNCAGIPEVGGLVTEAPDESYRRAFEVNFLGTVRMVKAIAPLMQSGGSIINIASLAAEIGFPTYATYGASKAALVNFTQIAALELGAAGIRVNCIEPSAVNTPMMDSPEAAAEAAVTQTLTPLGRICEPEEVAALVHFLAANDCKFINGQAIRICGGVSAGLSVELIETLVSGTS